MNHRMVAVPRHGCIEFKMIVEGAEGAIEFHFMSVNAREPGIAQIISDNGQFMSLGVEMHRRVPANEANRPQCWLLGGDPCYHDGTSLWASETVMPAFLAGGCEAVYPLLESCYRDRFLEPQR